VTDFLLVSAAAAVVCVVAMLVTAYAARRAGRVSVVDVTWGLALAAVALVCALLGTAPGWRRWLLVGLVAVWGIRLSWHIWRRTVASTRQGDGEDPRYTELLGSRRGGPLVRVWIPQGAAIWFVSLPVQVSAVAGDDAGPVVVIGASVWLLGLVFEAVGHEYWPTYFRTIDRVLAPGGRVGIQAILMPHDRMLATRRTYTLINKFIFPGGFLPSAQVIDEVNERHTGLRVTNRLAFGADYAETLQRWDTAFLAAADRVLGLGFDDTFLRMWHFYLEYSRAGFASGYLDVQQLTFRRPRHFGAGS
jgi:hypothetical protein